MSDLDVQIGKTVAIRRGDRSQQTVADAMRKRGHRWSQATMWAIEKGERPLKLTEAVHLSDVLGVSLQELMVPPRPVEDELRRRTRWATECYRDLLKQARKYVLALRLLRNTVADAEGQGIDESYADYNGAYLRLSTPPERAVEEARFFEGERADKAEVNDAFAADSVERERAVIVAMARFGFAIERISEILSLPVAHIRSTLGTADPAEVEPDRG